MRKAFVTAVLVGVTGIAGACIPPGGQPPGSAQLDLTWDRDTLSCNSQGDGLTTCEGVITLVLSNVGDTITTEAPTFSSPFGEITDNGCIHALSPGVSCTADLEVAPQTHPTAIQGIRGWATAEAGIASDTTFFSDAPPQLPI